MKAALSVALIAFAFTVLIGAVHPPGALAQGGTSADRIKAATAKVDGASIRANAAHDARLAELWARLRRDALQPARPDQRRQRQGPRPRLGVRPRVDARRRGDAAGRRRRHVRHAPRGASCTRSTCAPASGCGCFDPKVPREAGYKGCCDVVNRGVALYKGKVFVATYDGRLVALDAATGKPVLGEGHDHRPLALVHDHRRAARVQGQGDHRQRRRRVRRARLRHRLRRRRPARRAGAGSPCPAIPAKPFEDAVDGQGRQDLGPERQVLGGRRRRHRVGHAWPSTPSST